MESAPLSGTDPLHQALLTPEVDPEVVRALVEAGADTQISNSEGDTPFSIALERFERATPGTAAYRREEAITTIVRRGFEAPNDAHAKLCDLSWWRSSASKAAVQALLGVPGVDVNRACNLANDRPIHIPLRLTSFRLLPEDVYWGIEALVDGGANLMVKNGANESALDMAEVRFDRVTARIIQSQRRWCRGEIDSQIPEVGRNTFDIGAYFDVTVRATGQPVRQAEDKLRLELSNTTGTLTKEVVCPYRGINDYK